MCIYVYTVYMYACYMLLKPHKDFNLSLQLVSLGGVVPSQGCRGCLRSSSMRCDGSAPSLCGVVHGDVPLGAPPEDAWDELCFFICSTPRCKTTGLHIRSLKELFRGSSNRILLYRTPTDFISRFGSLPEWRGQHHCIIILSSYIQNLEPLHFSHVQESRIRVSINRNPLSPRWPC